MLWTALLLNSEALGTPFRTEQSLKAVAIWALQFTPRVALAPDAVLMEVKDSTRLFGGKRALRDRVVQEGAELGVGQVAWCSTSLGALAVARSGLENGFRKPLEAMLDALSMESLDAVRPHALTLAHIGCKTLGDVRRLPRGGISRRFDKYLLRALDQAYGLQPEVHQWVELPETFHARLELMHRVDLAPAMLFGARRLLLQLCAWLAARHCGTTAFTLKWAHDTMRSKEAGAGGQLTVRTAQSTRQIEHLCRLLAEHLTQVELLAPVGDLELTADEVQPLEEISASLLPDTVQNSEPMHLVLERLAARLGPCKVLRPVIKEDHRQEWMCQWQSAEQPLPRTPTASPSLAQPTFVLPEPIKLAVRAEKPIYQGELLLISGPQRVEGGWWDRDEAASETRNVVRDYWVAFSEHAGLLWIFQTRLSEPSKGGVAWFLHGHFA